MAARRGTRRRKVAHSRVRCPGFIEAPALRDNYVPYGRTEPLRWCARCGLPGQPGDARHPLPDEQLLAEAAAVAARITGERDLPAAA